MRIITSVLTLFCFTASAALAAGPDPVTDEQKAVYVTGLAISESLGNFALSETELEFVKAGLTDGVLKQPRKADLQAMTPKIQQLQQTRAAAIAEAEKKASAAFLAKAAAESGAKKTASGAIVTTLKEGSGATPKATDTVKVHYHETLLDGDSSVKREGPATFPLNQVISCWTGGLQHIKVGGKSRLVCPANLAYGDRGSPPQIKPGATLIFEVELLDIVK